MKYESIYELCDIVRETSYDIHVYLENGHLEKVYENALAHRLIKLGLKVEQQKHINIYDEDGHPLGNYLADIFVEDILLIELKACSAVNKEHVAQLIGYMRGAKIQDGLLINFGAQKLYIKKYTIEALLSCNS